MKRRDLLALLGGSAAMAAMTARAQQAAMPVIGFLDSGSAFPEAEAVFRRGLAESGYVVGRNLAIEYRWAEGRYDRLAGFAAELVRRPVALIAAQGLPAALAAKAATATIPIVFRIGSDPVKDHLVAGLSRPGGNVTGVTTLFGGMGAKRLELLRELVPGSATIALLVNPTNSNTEAHADNVQVAARTTGQKIVVLKASTERDIDAAFAALVQHRVNAVLVGDDPFFRGQRRQLVALAARHAMPTIYFVREFAAAGGLISYGSSIVGSYRQSGVYAGKVLRGARPADLPVEQPTKFELVVNMKTAKALGIAVPPSILARADEVIE